MKKSIYIYLFLTLAAITTAVTPALAEHPSHGNHEHNDQRGRNGHHRGYRDHHRHHHKEMIIAGIFFLVMNEIQERNESHEIIKRTAVVLKKAQTIAQENNSGFGLGDALAHQERARALYEKGKYRNAIYQTLWARAMALHFIDEPGPPQDEEDDWRNCDFRDCDLVYEGLTDTEANFMENTPSPVEMQEEISDLNITDESVLNYEIKSDL